ncbi:MAG: DUF4271 domain-containing protein, partial [Duncaniella sp.]|nr:DUF4271 domain-containing protein [Duncaniella sp.]
IILNAALWRGLAREVPGGEFTLLGGLMVLALLYYVWDLAAYTLVGAVFTDKVSAKMMMKGFNASQSLLAMLIVVPALIVLFNPSAAGVVAVLGIVSYVLTRVVFISKGFRLFYDNFGTWVYFILYLCSLEIVPLIIIYRAVRYITEMLLQN